jgi:hypothetical protein
MKCSKKAVWLVLFVFPGEGHVLMRLVHQHRKMVEEQKWFDKYFFNR